MVMNSSGSPLNTVMTLSTVWSVPHKNMILAICIRDDFIVMATFSKIFFVLSQMYIALASVLFVTGHVLKDPMQNALYLLYALTLPVVSVVLFILCCCIAILRKNLLLGVVNLINFMVLALLFIFLIVV